VSGSQVGRPGSRRRFTGTSGRRALDALGACVVTGVLLAACTSSVTAPSTSDGAPDLSTPLTSASTSALSGWATLPMGHLDDPLNTFWQLFHLSPGSSKWQLDTPPGVASNGGLAASVAPSGTVLAGFGASQLLLFSPLATSTDQGRSWSGSVLSWALDTVPDSLAVADSGRQLALLRSGQHVAPLAGTSGGVVSGSGDPAVWSGVVSNHALSATAAGAACRVQAITAVAFLPGGSGAVVGARCDATGRAGIFEQDRGGWVSVGPVLSGASGTEVVRLSDTAAGLSVLVREGSESAARLVALWGSGAPGARWTESEGLPLGGATLRSTATTVTGGFLILGSGGSTDRLIAAAAEPTTTAWQHLVPPPVGTTSVVATPSGTFDAFLPHHSTLVVEALTGQSWRRTQSIDVPIEYGSSS
jgi:hypothetical protein